MTMKTLYRIYTERKSNLAELAGLYFAGFTILEGVGHWKGVAEPSAIIEIIGTPGNLTLVNQLREHIALVNKQNSVALTVQVLHTDGF